MARFIDALGTYVFTITSTRPWAGEDLSLKIDGREQTIWIFILEL